MFKTFAEDGLKTSRNVRL